MSNPSTPSPTRALRWFQVASLTLFLSVCSGLPLLAQSGYHHLILGSFKTFEKASEALSQAQQTGALNPVILFPDDSNSWYRLSGYQSLHRAEVETFSRNLARQGKPKGWILTQTSTSISRGTSSPAASQRLATPTTEVSQARFHLVMESHPTFEKAEEGVAALRAKGMEPYVVFPSGTTQAYRVSVYAASDRSEVDAYAKMLSRSGMKGGWILEESGAPTTSVSPLTGSNARMATPSATAARSNASYHLIGGSFARFDEASDFAEASRAHGATPMIIFPEDGQQGNFRVSLRQSRNRGEIESFQRQLQNKGMNPGWIMAQ